MAQNLRADDEVTAAEAVGATETTLAARLIALAKAGFGSTTNGFGDAATRDSWDGSGDAPADAEGRLARLNADGQIVGNMLGVEDQRDATKTVQGGVRIWGGRDSLPSGLDDGDVAPTLIDNVLPTAGGSSPANPEIPGALLPDTAFRIGGEPDCFAERVNTASAPPDTGSQNRGTVFSVNDVTTTLRPGALRDSDIAGLDFRARVFDEGPDALFDGVAPIPFTRRSGDSDFGLGSDHITVPEGDYWVTAHVNNIRQTVYVWLSAALESDLQAIRDGLTVNQAERVQTSFWQSSRLQNGQRFQGARDPSNWPLRLETSDLTIYNLGSYSRGEQNCHALFSLSGRGRIWLLMADPVRGRAGEDFLEGYWTPRRGEPVTAVQADMRIWKI